MEEEKTARPIIIGKLGAPHGVGGYVRVTPLTDFPDRFDGLKEVAVGGKVLRVLDVKYFDKKIVIKFADYETPEAVKKLTGEYLTVSRDEAAPLKEGEFYAFDIIGLKVFDENDILLGTVTRIMKTGSNDVYEVRTDDGKELLIPALKSVVRAIDISAGRMVVVLPKEG